MRPVAPATPAAPEPDAAPEPGAAPAAAEPAPSVFEPVPRRSFFPREDSWAFEGTRQRCWTWPCRSTPEAGASRRPRAVMVHGFRGDHHGLALIADALAERWEVVVPDLPGFGRGEQLPGRTHDVETYAEAVASLLEDLGGEPVVLVGHSFGSVVAARVAARRPELVAVLALINPICEPALESSQRLAALGASAFYRLCASLPEALGDAAVRAGVVTRISSEVMMKNQDPALRRYINGQHAAYFGAFASRAVVLQAYDSSIRETVLEDAPRVLAPTLLVAAERDDLGSLAGQRTLAAAFPRAELEVIPQAGHLIHYEAPRRAAMMIDGFAEEQTA